MRARRYITRDIRRDALTDSDRDLRREDSDAPRLFSSAEIAEADDSLRFVLSSAAGDCVIDAYLTKTAATPGTLLPGRTLLLDDARKRVSAVTGAPEGCVSLGMHTRSYR